jgi:hypothetical protein
LSVGKRETEVVRAGRQALPQLTRVRHFNS